MTHLPPLIEDLAIILIVAALTTLVFKHFKQPIVLGYLLAGLLVGPHVTFFPGIDDTKSVNVWAEIGIIFLLFGLGLEFSFKKLAKVGKSAAIAALFEIITMTGAGYLLGQAFGWTRMDSLFLGAILSMSSTTIIIRAFQELGLKAKGFVSLVFGVLIVEDLAAMLILVILASIASPEPMSGTYFVYTTARLGFFLLLWFLVGIYFVPLVLRKVRKLLSDETTLVVSVGLCLMMVILATKADFSPALGAFVMGSILAETREGERIERLMVPVRDLFAAIFFVSVGMLIDPEVLKDNFGIILIIIAVTIVGKLFGSGFGALLSGRSLKQSMQAGLSLAQIGEFSFLIAILGVRLGATSDFLYPIVIAVSAVTTFTTPYMIKYSDPICSWLERHVPVAIRERIKRYEAVMSTGGNENVLSLLWKEYGPKVILNSVVVVAISLLISQIVIPEIEKTLGHKDWLQIVSGLVSLALCSPFLRAIVVGSAVADNPLEFDLLRRLHFGALFVRVLIAILLITFVIGQFTNVQTVSGVLLIGITALVVLFSRYSEPLYEAVENRFLRNLNDKERHELARISKPTLAPWNATLAEFVVAPNSPLIAKRLDESALKETTGATIAMIERGDQRILAPNRSAMLFPYDRVSMIGTDEQLELARAKIEVSGTPAPDRPAHDSFGLDSMILKKDSRYVGQSIRACGLREEVNGLIVGIEREGRRILNPDSSLELLAGDRVWIVGDLRKIKNVKAKIHDSLEDGI
jgi:CPA2 family monovalent cation:H+ antiporter-2